MTTPDFHAHAKQRLISNAYPGWWIQTFEEGTSDEKWLRVVSVKNFVPKDPGVLSNLLRPYTELLCVFDEETREAVEVRDYSNEYVLCCTKAEAKKAGVV